MVLQCMSITFYGQETTKTPSTLYTYKPPETFRDSGDLIAQHHIDGTPTDMQIKTSSTRYLRQLTSI